MEACKISNMYTLSETIAAGLFEGAEYPWEVLPKIHDFILELGKSLPADKFEKRGEDIWIAKSATVAPTACLNGPLIGCGNQTLCVCQRQRHCGKGCRCGKFHRIEECGFI